MYEHGFQCFTPGDLKWCWQHQIRQASFLIWKMHILIKKVSITAILKYLVTKIFSSWLWCLQMTFDLHPTEGTFFFYFDNNDGYFSYLSVNTWFSQFHLWWHQISLILSNSNCFLVLNVFTRFSVFIFGNSNNFRPQPRTTQMLPFMQNIYTPSIT